MPSAFTSADRALALLAELERRTRVAADHIEKTKTRKLEPDEGDKNIENGGEEKEETPDTEAIDDEETPAEERQLRDGLLGRYLEDKKHFVASPPIVNDVQQPPTPANPSRVGDIVRSYMRTQEPVLEFISRELLARNIHPSKQQHHRSDGPLSASITSSEMVDSSSTNPSFPFPTIAAYGSQQTVAAAASSPTGSSDNSMAGTVVYSSHGHSLATTPMAGSGGQLLGSSGGAQNPSFTIPSPMALHHGTTVTKSALEAQFMVAVEEAKADGYRAGFREGGRSAVEDLAELRTNLSESKSTISRLEAAVEFGLRQQDTLGFKLANVRGDNSRLRSTLENLTIDDIEKIIEEREFVMSERDRLYKLVVRFLPSDIPLPLLGGDFDPGRILADFDAAAAQQAANVNRQQTMYASNKKKHTVPSRQRTVSHDDNADIDIRRAHSKISALEGQLEILNQRHMEAFDIQRQQRTFVVSHESDSEVFQSKRYIDQQVGQLFSMLGSRGAESSREYAMVESLHKFISTIFGTVKGIFLNADTLLEIQRHFSAVTTHLLPILSRTTATTTSTGVQGNSTTASMSVDESKMVVVRAAAAVADMEDHANLLEGSLTRFTQKMQRVLRQTLAKKPRSTTTGGASDMGTRSSMFSSEVIAEQNKIPEVVELMAKASHIRDLLDNCQQIIVTNEVLNPNMLDMQPEPSQLSPNAAAASRRRRNMFKQLVSSNNNGGGLNSSTDTNKTLLSSGEGTLGGDGTGTGILANVANFVPKMGPVGKVTLVFTDIQSSTLLWQLHSDKMRAALTAHNAILRALMPKYNGYEVKTIGDAFMIAFADPTDAVNYAMQIQVDLMAHTWEEPFNQPIESTMTRVAEESGKAAPLSLWNGLRVRVGIHTGNPLNETDCVTKRTDYFGPVVNLSARVQGAALGGQTLISDEVRNNVALGKLDVPCSIKPGGTHNLKGIDRPVELHSILPTALELREEDFDYQLQMKVDKAAADKRDGRASEEDPVEAKQRREAEAMIAQFASGEKELCFVSLFLQRLPELLDHQWEFCITTFYSTFLQCVSQVGGYLSKDNGVNMYQVVFEDAETALRFAVQIQNVCLGLEYGDEISDATDLYAEDNKTLLYRGVSPKIGLHLCRTEGSFDPFANKVLFNKGEASLSTGLSLNARMGEVLASEALIKQVPITNLSDFYIRELASPVVVPGVASVFSRLVFAPSMRERLLLRAEFAEEIMDGEESTAAQKLTRKNTPPPAPDAPRLIRRSSSLKKLATIGTQTTDTLDISDMTSSPPLNTPPLTGAANNNNRSDDHSVSSGVGGGLFTPIATPPSCQECGGDSVPTVCLKCLKLQCRSCTTEFSIYGKCKRCIGTAAVTRFQHQQQQQLAQSINSNNGGAVTSRTSASDGDASRRSSPTTTKERRTTQHGSPRGSVRNEKSIDLERSKSNVSKSSTPRLEQSVSSTKRGSTKDKGGKQSRRKQQAEFNKRLYAATASSLHRITKKEAEEEPSPLLPPTSSLSKLNPSASISAPIDRHGSLLRHPSNLQKDGGIGPRRPSSLKLLPLESKMSPTPSDLANQRSRSNNNIERTGSFVKWGASKSASQTYNAETTDSDDDGEPLVVIPATQGSFHFVKPPLASSKGEVVVGSPVGVISNLSRGTSGTSVMSPIMMTQHSNNNENSSSSISNNQRSNSDIIRYPRNLQPMTGGGSNTTVSNEPSTTGSTAASSHFPSPMSMVPIIPSNNIRTGSSK